MKVLITMMDIAVYSKNFHISSELAEKELVLVLGKIDDIDELYILMVNLLLLQENLMKTRMIFVLVWSIMNFADIICRTVF